MSEYAITLKPFRRAPIQVPVSEQKTDRDAVRKLLAPAKESGVFSDLTYEILLPQDAWEDAEKVSVCVNGEERFTGSQEEKGGSHVRLFLDCYGFAELSVTLTLRDRTEKTFYSEFLPVLVPADGGKKGNAHNIEKIASYAYDHMDILFQDGKKKAGQILGYRSIEKWDLSHQIELAGEIAEQYERSLGYFRANSRFRIDKVAKIDQFEHLQSVTPSTIAYIASHPEQLRPVTGPGLRIGRSTYQPQKTLIMQNVCSYDIPENRILLGFLERMEESAAELKKHCRKLLEEIPGEEPQFDPHYYVSSYFLLAKVRQTLVALEQQLAPLSERFARLRDRYRSVWDIAPEPVFSGPRPTPIFLSVPQYNRLFVLAHRWFDAGGYDYSREHIMLSWAKSSAVYELYLLIKWTAYFKSRGYSHKTEQNAYAFRSKQTKYENTDFDNVHIFQKGDTVLTLYYQPVIYDSDKSSEKGIGLYRSTGLSPGYQDESYTPKRECYFTPDYLLKISRKGKTDYFIMDAKFSPLKNVKEYHIQELAFKYLFGVSPLKEGDRVAGLGVLYGACSPEDRLESAFDKELDSAPALPVVVFQPLAENIPQEVQEQNLDLLMERLGVDHRVEGAAP